MGYLHTSFSDVNIIGDSRLFSAMLVGLEFKNEKLFEYFYFLVSFFGRGVFYILYIKKHIIALDPLFHTKS